MRLLTLLLVLAGSIYCSAQSNPIPLVNQSLTPASVPPGGPNFTLTVNGSGFVAGATVQWNGHLRNTTFVSSTQVRAVIRDSDIATAGTATIRVKNPTPGGGISNGVLFPVTLSTPAIGFTSHAPGAGGAVVVPLDFDLDGKQDIAFISQFDFSGTLELDRGNGDGTFTKITQSSTTAWPYDMVVADFNQDGKPDIAIACYDDSVRVTLNQGRGRFSTLKKFPAGAGFSATSLIAGDFNGDGKLDLLVLGGALSFLAGNGDGTFQPAIVTNNIGLGPTSFVAGDFNRDGKLDVAITDGYIEALEILFGNGDGTFQAPVDYSALGQGLVTADFNGDHILDLAFSNGPDDTVTVMLGNSDGSFQQSTVIQNFGTTPFHLGVEDLNGDGKLDIASPSTSGFTAGAYALGNGDGTFQSAQNINAGNASYSLALADFNNDGRIDLYALGTNGFAGAVLLQTAASLSQGSLTFPPQLVGTSSAPQMVTLTNVGTGAISITGFSITGSFATSYHEQNDCPKSLAVGASCTITVIFNPQTATLCTATLNISDNAAGTPQTLALSGSGSAMKATPSSLDFGNVAVGMTSQPMTVTLSNLSSVSVQIFNPTIIGDFAQTNNCPSFLNGHQSCSYSVTFTPTVIGRRSGTLYIVDADSGSPQTISLSGNGTP